MINDQSSQVYPSLLGPVESGFKGDSFTLINKEKFSSLREVGVCALILSLKLA